MNPVIKTFSALCLGLAVSAGFVGCAAQGKQESTGQYLDDATITTKVKAAIFNDGTLKATEVKVETYHGVVQLSGFVSSRDAMNRAVQLARDVQGVRDVKNDMQLK